MRTHKPRHDVTTRTDPPNIRKKADTEEHMLPNSVYIKHKCKQSQGLLSEVRTAAAPGGETRSGHEGVRGCGLWSVS